MIAKALREDQFQRDVTQVYYGVWIYVQTMNKKRMPSLKALLARTALGESHTPTQQAAMVKAMHAIYGGKLREVKH